MDIRYKRLNTDNFNVNSLDGFIRHQAVHESWRKVDGQWKLVPDEFEENWSPEQCREIAEDVMIHTKADQTAFGAFLDDKIIGFVTVSHNLFGTTAKYAELVCFQVSKPFRGQGIGKQLFLLVVAEAEKLGAEKLYISAHSSKESQAAYEALGCIRAVEINEKLAACEPLDVQMEYRLKRR